MARSKKRLDGTSKGTTGNGVIKKILVEELKPGMFVADFNCGWFEHPFFANTLLIKTPADIKKIREHGIRELYIDTARGLDMAGAKTRDEVRHEMSEEMHRLFAQERRELNAVPMKEEIHKAKTVKSEAKKAVTDILQEVRLGRQIEVERTEHVVEKMVDSIFRNVDALTSLSRIKSKDQYTFMHSVNVCVLMISFCRFLGVEREVIKKVGVGALLHDIGKMKVADAVLNKPGALTDAEFGLMKSHVTHGHDILIATPGIPFEAIQVASEHHERFDGTGYPNRLGGDDISRFGQMASIADVYDAITTTRVYHKGLEPAEAIRRIFEWSKHHFNGDLTQFFIKCVGIYPVGTLVGLENGLLGVVSVPGEKNILRPSVRVIFDTRTETYVAPHDVDLEKRRDHGYVIKGYEDPEQWRISPLKFLDLEGVL